jgi:integrase
MEHVGDPFSPVLTLLIESGIRTSEALGITWPKLDLDAETLRIHAQLGKGGELTPTKTKRVRTIPISAHAAATLRAYRDAQEANGVDVTRGLVFTTRNGKPHSRRNVYRAWTAALGKVGIEDAHLHSLRHSFISGHAERGTAVVKVSALVGHSNVEVTQRVYTRIAGTEEARIESLREALAA